MASFSVAVPLVTSWTRAPSSFMRKTFRDWRLISSVPMKISHSMIKQRGNGRGRNTMLTGTGFGNHLAFAHATGQENLPDRIVNLMSAGMIQVFTLQIYLGPPRCSVNAAAK